MPRVQGVVPVLIQIDHIVHCVVQCEEIIQISNPFSSVERKEITLKKAVSIKKIEEHLNVLYNYQ